MSWGNAAVEALLIGAGIAIGHFARDWWIDAKTWWRGPAASRFFDSEF